MEYSDGAIYDGIWVDDKIAGRGICISANGDRYEWQCS